MNQPAASLPIFRAGTHTSVDGRTFAFSPAIVKEIAESYDPQLSEAPLVIGHPKLDAPAYGWAKTLRADGDLLYAEPHQVEPQFAEGVNAGRFKRISASIYLPDSPGNPKPGKHYLRHIGFLGAAAPSVKGLPSAQFAEGDGAVEFAHPLGGLTRSLVDLLQRLRDFFVEREGADAADRILPQWSIRSIDELAQPPVEAPSSPAYSAPCGNIPEIVMPDPTAVERESQIAHQQAGLAAREQALAQREAKARRNEAVAFAQALVKDGKLLPRQQAPVVELLLVLPVDTPLNFAEGEAQVTQPAADTLRALLNDLPQRLDFREKSGADTAPAVADFSAPCGIVVDASRVDLHQRAKAYQAQHAGSSYLDAIRAVGG